MPPSATVPITDASISHFSARASTSATWPGSTKASMRSCDSDIRISAGVMSCSRRCTASRSTSMPIPALAAHSDVAHEIPAPPRSWIPTTRSRSYSSRQASMSCFSSNGSPTWTVGRLAPASSSKLADASTDTPPIPSRPVALPSSTARLPGPEALASTSWSSFSRPSAMTLTSGLLA